MCINERLPKHKTHINSEAVKKLCSLHYGPKLKISFQPVNYINNLHKVKNVVLGENRAEKNKNVATWYDESSTSNDQENFSLEMRKQKKY